MSALIKPQDTAGGIKRFWVVPVDDIASIGDVILNELQSFALKSGKHWISIYAIYNDRGFEENRKENDKSIRYERSFEAFHPGYSVASLLQFDEMKQKRFVLAYEDNNELFKLIGNLDNPLKFTYKLTTGKNGSSDHGVKLEFSADSNIRVIESTNDVLNVAPLLYDDWFLPSIYELLAMYDNLHAQGIGGFKSERYWSSTESSSVGAMLTNFSTGLSGTIIKNSTPYNVRACRRFVDYSNKYVVGQQTLAGGFVFYKNGNIYYECAEMDIGKEVWSDLREECGASGKEIGDGIENTTIITNYVRYTRSAAKLCNDLEITA